VQAGPASPRPVCVLFLRGEHRRPRQATSLALRGSHNFEWKYPTIDIENIAIEERGKFRIEGEISIEQRRLRGTIRLGLIREYLDWLPNPEEVFSRKQGGYLWTNVRLSGTIDDPGQDLSPRIIELFKESPGAYLRLLFRQFEGWLKKDLAAINSVLDTFKE
jgi:hypothetical protein